MVNYSPGSTRFPGCAAMGFGGTALPRAEPAGRMMIGSNIPEREYFTLIARVMAENIPEREYFAGEPSAAAKAVTMRTDDLRSIFAGWSAQDLAAAGVTFQETLDPPSHPTDDYRVIYEAHFVPESLDKARIEFWLTDDGYVAVGIETYQRILQRLDLKAMRRGFAGGHEPSAKSKDGLKTLFDAATRGKIHIVVVRSVLRLVASIEIFVAEDACAGIERAVPG